MGVGPMHAASLSELDELLSLTRSKNSKMKGFTSSGHSSWKGEFQKKEEVKKIRNSVMRTRIIVLVIVTQTRIAFIV
jgi:hypothetical protein